MEENKKQEERELNFICDIIVRLTKENAENPTPAIKRLFRWAYHETWMLKSFSRPLASKKAFDYFYEKTGQDIRDFGWDDTVKDKNGQRFLVRKDCMHEHMIPSSMIEKMLMKEFKQGTLTIEKVKDIISKQRICWILREEDEELDRRGYRSYRANPMDAYMDVGIELYDEDTTRLKKMFDELNLKDVLVEKEEKIIEKEKTMEEVTNVPQLFVELAEYFDNKKIEVKGRRIRLTTYKNANYATIFKEKGVWVNVRTNTKLGGGLLDIGMYFEGGKVAKDNFDKFYAHKNQIEKYMGKLVWQRDCLFKSGSQTSRISQYSKYAAPSRAPFELIEEIRKNPYTFNPDDIKAIAKELVKYYEVFVADVLNIFD